MAWKPSPSRRILGGALLGVGISSLYRLEPGLASRANNALRMRILATVQSYFPFQERGGPVFKVRSLGQGLAKRGHEVTVLTADLGILGKNGSGEISFSRCPWGWCWRENGVETIYLSTIGHYRALTINPSVIRFSRASLKAFDVVHVFGLYDLLGPVVSHFCRQNVIPYVLEPMGMHRPIVRNVQLKRLYHLMLGSQMTAGAAFVVATSAQEQQELVDSGICETRIAVRRNGIDAPGALPTRGEFRKKWSIDPNAKIILFLGRLVSKKSPDLLVKAFAAWRSRDPQNANSVLVLAGPEQADGFGSELRQLVGNLGVSHSTFFVGPLFDSDKWEAYRDADVFVLPSQNENFGNTAAESAACGTPVIVTDHCGIAPHIGAAGVVIPHDIVDLERALDRMLKDSDFLLACQRGCVDMANSLSWEGPLDQTEQLYSRCVSDRLPREVSI